MVPATPSPPQPVAAAVRSPELAPVRVHLNQQQGSEAAAELGGGEAQWMAENHP
ncbi:hypothetical protein J7E96_08205 [Streptomyces sp. ISL-96]|nr:hypothetical protein [Streptomyces sp. ISL-96]MBT2488503.1 hypothetical protein [Streptomyces sp. ISL-96]